MVILDIQLQRKEVDREYMEDGLVMIKNYTKRAEVIIL